MNSKKPYHILILISIGIALNLLSCRDQNKTNTTTQKEQTKAPTNPAWADVLIQAFRAVNESSNLESADLLFEAAELMPKKNWEIYFLATTIYAPMGEKDKAFSALDKAIEAGLIEVELLENYPDIASLKEDPRWEETLLKAVQAKKSTRPKSKIPNC